MRKIIAVLIAVLALAVVAAPASAKPGQYTRFNVSTAANGAHAYARSHMDAAKLKTAVHCRMSKWSGSGYVARWVCGVTTYVGASTEQQHAVVGVLRKDGHYVFRTYKLVELGESVS